MKGFPIAALVWLALLQGARAEEVVASVAASLRAPSTELARRFEAAHPGAKLLLAFGASNELASQIEAGAPVEVFLAADEESVARLASKGLLLEGSAVPFAGNRLVVVRPDASELRLAEPRDLVQPALRRLALPGEGVPLGHYAREWLARRGILADLADRIVVTANAAATLAAVELGQADAGIVYATDARAAKRAHLAFEIPDAEQPRIVYVGALTKRAGPGARAFLDFVRGPGAAILEAAGFRAAPGPGATGSP
jgi:molybdate transport system substrate-binding protein